MAWRIINGGPEVDAQKLELKAALQCDEQVAVIQSKREPVQSESVPYEQYV